MFLSIISQPQVLLLVGGDICGDLLPRNDQDLFSGGRLGLNLGREPVLDADDELFNRGLELTLHDKVGGLRHVEAVVKARVIGVGEGDDHIPFLLDELVDLDPVGPEQLGTDHETLVPHRVEAGLGHVGEQLPGQQADLIFRFSV